MSKTKETVRDLKRRLSDTLKQMLGERATLELMKKVAPNLVDELKMGKATPTVGDLLARKVIRLALDPTKGYQWAVEMVWDRMEGKATQGAPVRDDGTATEKKLNDLTKEHLDSIAAEFVTDARRPERPEASDEAPGPANKLLDLSKDEAAGPENEGGQSPVAAGAAKEGPGGSRTREDS